MRAITQQAEHKLISAKSMKNLVSKGVYGVIGQLFTVDMQLVPLQKEETTLEIILNEYKDVFQEPVDLPPERSIEHQITLIPNAVPR